MNISEHRLYQTARGIYNRCRIRNKKYYGAKGVECRLGKTSKDIINSLESIDGWFEGAQIDRIDNDGHYEIGNLRWVTPKENIHNSTVIKDVKHYETNDSYRGTFKEICNARGWNFDNFNEIYSRTVEYKRKDRLATGKIKKYFYKMK